MTAFIGEGVAIEATALTMYAGPWLTASRRPNDGLMLAEVNGVPSWKVTPGRKVAPMTSRDGALWDLGPVVRA